MLRHKKHSKHLYISGVLSPHLTLQMHATFNASRDDKINDCSFNFSVAHKWHVLIQEDKDNSLQFANVFLAKFLKLPIRQRFPHATILCYMVVYWSG